MEIVWVLVYLMVNIDGGVKATTIDLPMTMEECFKARDMLSVQVGDGNGGFNLNTQAICVQSKIKY